MASTRPRHPLPFPCSPLSPAHLCHCSAPALLSLACTRRNIFGWRQPLSLCISGFSGAHKLSSRPAGAIRLGQRTGYLNLSRGSSSSLDTNLEGAESFVGDGTAWDEAKSSELYRIHGWGAPYFSINSQGHVSVWPLGSIEGSDELDLVDLVEALKMQNIKLPMVIRFPDIMQHRIQLLHDCFSTAIIKYGYKQHFQGVFPIKCNHDCYLLEDMVKFGQQFSFGLEAGSKPELLIAIAKLRQSKDALLICNGYKDQVYVESVLLARQLGLNAVIVLEQIEELDLLIRISRTLRVKPLIGVRAKLSTKHNGHWGGTSGENGKFGLAVNEIVRVVYTLRREGMLDCLQLLHFHIGSQVSSISTIKEAMREGSHIYCELALMGAPMHYIDVGGGLGIDYDGTKSQSSASTNYSMQNYANDVVAALMDACILKGVSQPVIVSESGRALASHHSVLVFDVLSVSQRSEVASLKNLEMPAENGKLDTGVCGNLNDKPDQHIQTSVNGLLNSKQDPGTYLLSTFLEVYNTMGRHNFQEAYNDAKQFQMEASSLFKLGCLNLEQRAQADALYGAISHRTLALSQGYDVTDELKELKRSLAPIYHVNLSIFRSVPDSWAIGQVFPVVPLQRLMERPNIQATLADLTCDSDGKIDKFLGASGEIEGVLSVHELRHGEPYYLGLFLAGVYQEVMGSAHNLFGGTNVVHIRSRASSSGKQNSNPFFCKQNAGYTIECVKQGHTMAEVLRAAEHVGEDMIEELRREGEEGVSNGRLTLEEAQGLLLNYQRSLNSYTYLA